MRCQSPKIIYLLAPLVALLAAPAGRSDPCFDAANAFARTEAKNEADPFFSVDRFNESIEMLRTGTPGDSPALWRSIAASGLDTVITLEVDGRQHQGRMDPQFDIPLVRSERQGKWAVGKVELFDDSGVRTTITLDGALQVKLSLKRAPVTLPEDLASAPLSEVAAYAGIPFLTRATTLKVLIAAYQTSNQSLVPVPSAEWKPAAYMHLANREFKATERFGWHDRFSNEFEQIYLLFDNQLLNRADFYVNPTTDFGNIVPGKTLEAGNQNLRKALYLYGRCGVWGKASEVFFTGNIPLGAIKAFVVNPGQRQRVLEFLKRGGVHVENIESLVVESTNLDVDVSKH